MLRLAELEFDEVEHCYSCKHTLGRAAVEVFIDVSEESVELSRLVEVAQSVSDSWQSRHERLTKLAAEELASNDYVGDASEVVPEDCIPFYLRVYADPDGEISYTIAFNVPSVLDVEDEYVDVEEEISGEWVNTEVCSTE